MLCMSGSGTAVSLPFDYDAGVVDPYPITLGRCPLISDHLQLNQRHNINSSPWFAQAVSRGEAAEEYRGPKLAATPEADLNPPPKGMIPSRLMADRIANYL